MGPPVAVAVMLLLLPALASGYSIVGLNSPCDPAGAGPTDTMNNVCQRGLVCVRGVCKVLGAAGGDCTATGTQGLCQPGLFPKLSGATCECQPEATFGQECWLPSAVSCEAGLSCVQRFRTTQPFCQLAGQAESGDQSSDPTACKWPLVLTGDAQKECTAATSIKCTSSAGCAFTSASTLIDPELFGCNLKDGTCQFVGPDCHEEYLALVQYGKNSRRNNGVGSNFLYPVYECNQFRQCVLRNVFYGSRPSNFEECHGGEIVKRSKPSSAFDGGSFAGGMFLAGGLLVVVFLGYKYYKHRGEKYRRLT